MSNWCWWEWGFKFSRVRNLVKKLPFVNPKKLDKTYNDIEEKHCWPHDKRFEVWGGLYDFIKANYIFALWVAWMMYWTTVRGRVTIFSVLFSWTTLLWWRYFNWTCIYKKK